jgi:hypothetical protein
MTDFTITIYKKLLEGLQKEGYLFQTFAEFSISSKDKSIILRHDVDLLPQNSLRFAKIQNEMGIKGTYYFRAVPESFDESVIMQIAKMGHEVGYHYESLSICKGDVDLAYTDFCFNLKRLRNLVNVETISPHGSPTSIHDNKDIWKKYDYKLLNILAEPYFDIDFSKVFYLTDTGRRWDGHKVSVRDKIPVYDSQWEKGGLVFHTTNDLINRVHQLPNQIMITFHPQRWHDKLIPWYKELILQNIKNSIKRLVMKMLKG